VNKEITTVLICILLLSAILLTSCKKEDSKVLNEPKEDNLVRSSVSENNPDYPIKERVIHTTKATIDLTKVMPESPSQE